MSHRNGNKTNGTPEEASPRVDLATFKDIVEGRRDCPTIEQLAGIVERESQHHEPLPIDRKIREHLDCCPSCADLCAAIRSVAETACAAERTITGLPAPSP